MTELDVLNQMLGTLGEAPLQDEDDEHPLLPAAKRRLASTTEVEQGRGWWFNRETITLHPNPDTGEVYITNDILSIDPLETDSSLVFRGPRLYDTANTTYNIGKDVVCRILRNVEFDNLPFNMQNLISAAATRQFNLDYDGDPIKLRQAIDLERTARIELGKEDIRNSNHNMLRRPTTARTLNRICDTSGRLRTA